MTSTSGIFSARARFPEAPKCARCDKSVYQAEEALGPAGRKYHKSCLTCITCNKRLDSLQLVEHGGDPYCKQCHSNHFGPKGYGFGGAVTGEYPARAKSPAPPSTSPSQPPKTFSRPSPKTSRTTWAADLSDDQLDDAHSEPFVGNGSPSPNRVSSPIGSVARAGSSPSPGKFAGLGATIETCRRCGKPVYFAEQVLAVGQKWHKRCLRCAGCDVPVSSHLSVNGCLPYCNRCYEQNFGQGFLK